MSLHTEVPLHPGEVLLKEYLEPLGQSQRQFAAHLGWTYARLNEIINLKRGITVSSALGLSEALNTTPEYWLILQLNWDLARAKQTHIPVKQLIINGDKL